LLTSWESHLLDCCHCLCDEKLIIKSLQNSELEDVFGVPVYDRYMIVIQIFQEHAVTKEAKLQIAMAEIPYLRYVC
jgi:50S ribosomal subunit-associated GTPase HflX